MNPIGLNSFRIKSARNALHSESNPDLLGCIQEKSDFSGRFFIGRAHDACNQSVGTGWDNMT